MDSPAATQLLRQLFTHRACRAAARSHSTLPFRIQQHTRAAQRPWPAGRRAASGRASKNDESNWQQRTELMPQDMSGEYSRYPTVTAEQLRGRKERPRRVKMLMRDFIEGLFSLSSAAAIEADRLA